MKIILGFFALSVNALAVDYNIEDASRLTSSAVSSMIETIGIGADHRAYEPATPQGLAIGLDVGIEATLIGVPQAFEDALAVSGDTKSLPPFLPVPRLNVHKGLPLGIDIGGSWISFQRQRIIGFDIKWAFFSESDRDKKREIILPNLALRYSYNNSKLWFLKTQTHAVDALASYDLTFIEPYLGFGYQFGSGTVEISDPALPAGISLKHSFGAFRVFFGLPLKMVFFELTPEVSHSFAGITTYGAKLSVDL